jgi:hypothetical protein
MGGGGLADVHDGEALLSLVEPNVGAKAELVTHHRSIVVHS